MNKLDLIDLALLQRLVGDKLCDIENEKIKAHNQEVFDLRLLNHKLENMRMESERK